jgi:hypothetical protein
MCGENSFNVFQQLFMVVWIPISATLFRRAVLTLWRAFLFLGLRFFLFSSFYSVVSAAFLWSDWVNLEVCYPTLHVYGIVAHAVGITVNSDASPLQHNDIVLARWRDQPTKQPSPMDSAS